MRWLTGALLAVLAACGTPSRRAPADLVIQTGHREWIDAIVWSPDGARLYTGANDGFVHVWDVRTGRSVRAHSIAGRVTGLARSPDGASLFVGGKPTIEIDASSGAVRRTYAGHEHWADSLALSPDGRTLATGSYGRDPRILLWDTTRDAPPVVLEGHEWGIRALAFSDDGRLLASAGRDPHVRVWDVASRTVLVQAECPEVNALVFTHDASRLAILAQFRLRILDLKAGSVAVVAHATGKDPCELALHPSRNALAIGDAEDPLRLWELDRRVASDVLEDRPQNVTAMAFSPDGTLLATAGTDRSLVLWDVAKGRLVREFRTHRQYLTQVRCAGLPLVLCSLHQFERSVVWDLATGRPRILEVGTPLAFAPGGRAFADDRAVRSWPDAAETARLEKPFRIITTFRALAFSPDGGRLYGSSNNFDARTPNAGLHVWDARTGAHLARWGSTWDVAQDIAVAPDGRIAAGFDDGRIDVLSSADGSRTATWSCGQDRINAVAFSPEGLLAAGGEGGGGLWTSDGARVADLGLRRVLTLRWSRSGRLLAVANQKELSVWDVPARRELYRLKEHDWYLWAADFSPDERFLLAGGWDGALGVRDAATGALVATCFTPDGAESVVATPDNYYFATRGALDLVSFRVGERIHPFEQFDLALNRPEIVLERLGCASPESVAAYRQASRHRRQRAGLGEGEAAFDVRAPEVTLRDLPPPVVRERTIRFRAESSDASARLTVYANDVPVHGTRGRAPGGEIELDLVPGRNKVQVAARNSRGVESLRATFDVMCDVPSRPRLRLLAIGAGRYEKMPALRFPAKDAQDVIAAFRALWGEEAEALALLDGEATRERILEARAFLAASRPEDVVLVYVSGHGLLDASGTYWFCTPSTEPETPSVRGLSFADFDTLFDAIPSRRRLLIVDTCHSGERAPAGPAPKADVVVTMQGGVRVASVRRPLGFADSVELAREVFADLGRASGAIVLAAAGAEEYARERGGELRNGVFTSVILEALARADVGTASTLRDYAVPRVLELTGGRQRPAMRGGSIEFDVPLKPPAR